MEQQLTMTEFQFSKQQQTVNGAELPQGLVDCTKFQKSNKGSER
ncbi:hypothetical protein V7150_01305 [Neobacillus drentensis]